MTYTPIDQAFYDAVKNQKTLNRNNTYIVENVRYFTVYLHNNIIAHIWRDKSVIELFSAGWATRLTQSRLQIILNALGFKDIIIKLKGNDLLFTLNDKVIATNSLRLRNYP